MWTGPTTHIDQPPLLALPKPRQDILQHLSQPRRIHARHTRRKPRLAHAPPLHVEMDARLAFRVSLFVLRSESRHERGTLGGERGVRVLGREGWIVREELLLDGVEVCVVVFFV